MPSANYENPENMSKSNESSRNSEQEQDPQPVREITQTDKLNKKLLQCFLTRINESGLENTTPDSNDIIDEEWDTTNNNL